MKAAGTTTLDQTRYHNAVNEIAGNGGNSITASTGTNWADPVYDDAGNTTTMPQPVVLHADLCAHLRCLEPARDDLRRLQEDQNVQENEYDGLGRRIVRAEYSSSGTLTYRLHCYYNEDWQFLEGRKEVSGTEDTDPFESVPVASRTTSTPWPCRIYDSDTDGSGDRRLLLPPRCQLQRDGGRWIIRGAAVERYRYTPYGEVSFMTGSSPAHRGSSGIGNEYLYTGREQDKESRLQLNRQSVLREPFGEVGWSRPYRLQCSCVQPVRVRFERTDFEY